MGKQKHGVKATPASKNKTPIDSELHGSDSWVMVKKQRVTILIPPLTYARKSSMRKPDTSKVVSIPMEMVNDNPTVTAETYTRIPEPDEHEKITTLTSDKDMQMIRKDPAEPFALVQKSPRLDATVDFKNLCRADTFKRQNVIRVSNITKISKQPQLLHGPGGLLDGRTLLNQRLRASLLERKLKKAGGLSRWLTSLGLERFERIFQGKCVNKFQLANLSMKKLKDMGADAVGPRRKLIHAIDCICQPYCFKTC